MITKKPQKTPNQNQKINSIFISMTFFKTMTVKIDTIISNDNEMITKKPQKTPNDIL